MPNRNTTVLIAWALCWAPLAAAAQPAAPDAGKAAPATVVAPVIVQAAPTATPTVIEKESHTFVQSHASAHNPEIDQIGRWYDPVCVQVVGLPDAKEAANIKARIESVALAVGVPAARAGCTANVEIVFTPYPQLTMDVVAKRKEYFLGYFHTHERNRLKTVTHPIQSWYVTATRGEAVGSVALAFSMFASFNQQQTEVIDDPDNQPPNGCADSRVSTSCLWSSFHNVFIVADSKALQGKDLGLVADYMVMLALSEPHSLDGCNGLASVIDAFANSSCPGRAAPDGLTPADAAYLTALYQSDLRAKPESERYEIAQRMAKILLKANAGAN